MEKETSDNQLYKQAGNGVTVNVIEAIGRNLKAVDEEIQSGSPVPEAKVGEADRPKRPVFWYRD